MASLHVMNVSCMKLCPKDGITVCLPQDAADRLVILKRESDIDQL